MLGGVKIDFRDGGLGLVPTYPTGIPLFVGSSNSGSATPNTVYHLTSDNPEKVLELFGNTTLAKRILDAFSSGAGIVRVVKAQDGTLANLMTAIEEGVNQSLIDGEKNFEFIVLTDTADKTVASAVASYLQNLEQSQDVYTWAILCARDKANTETDYDTYVNNLITEWQGFTHPRICVVASYTTISNLTGETRYDNVQGIVAGLVSIARVNEDIGWVEKFKIPSIVELPKGLNLAHIQALDEAGFLTVRTYNGVKGYFITSPRMFVDETSDFHLIQYRRVSDKAGTLIRKVLLQSVRADVRAPIDADPQNPPPPEKSPTIHDILTRMKAILRDEMLKRQEIYGYQVWIPEGQNIWSTKKLQVKYRIAPNPVLVWIEGEFKFWNPLLEGRT